MPKRKPKKRIKPITMFAHLDRDGNLDLDCTFHLTEEHARKIHPSRIAEAKIYVVKVLK